MDPLVLVAGAVGMLATSAKVIDFLRLAANWATQKSAVVTQFLAWLGGTATVFLYANSDLGDFVIPGTDLVLEDAAAGTLVLLGLAIGSLASLANDFRQAFDSTDSAVKPPLLK